MPVYLEMLLTFLIRCIQSLNPSADISINICLTNIIMNRCKTVSYGWTRELYFHNLIVQRRFKADS